MSHTAVLHVNENWKYNLLRVRRASSAPSLHDDHEVVAVIKTPVQLEIMVDRSKSDLFWWKLEPGMKDRLKEAGALVKDYNEETEGFITSRWAGVPPLVDPEVVEGKKCRRPSCNRKPWEYSPFLFCSRQCEYPEIDTLGNFLEPDSDGSFGKQALVVAADMQPGTVKDVQLADGGATKVLVVQRHETKATSADIVRQFEQWLWFHAEETAVPHIVLLLDAEIGSVRGHERQGYHTIGQPRRGGQPMYKLISLGRRVDMAATELPRNCIEELEGVQLLQKGSPLGKEEDPNLKPI